MVTVSEAFPVKAFLEESSMSSLKADLRSDSFLSLGAIQALRMALPRIYQCLRSGHERKLKNRRRPRHDSANPFKMTNGKLDTSLFNAHWSTGDRDVPDRH